MAFHETAGKATPSFGGDKNVERDHLGRPRIITTCDRCEGVGRVPSIKRPGNTVKCNTCNGEGKRKLSYTRVTTFIDVLEDKENIADWRGRMVLRGAAMDEGFLSGVLDVDPETPDGRNMLSMRAQAAAKAAGSEDKSEVGTRLHDLSELVDSGLPMPDATDSEYNDMVAYHLATKDLTIVHMEKLVVNEQYKVAGTPDRVSLIDPECGLVAPDGYRFGADELAITDLKTGRVDFGGLKMAMQLSIYANSELYNQDGTREPLGPVNRKWGLIIHLPAGSARCTLYWADLELGWDAVALAKQVRDIRRIGKRDSLTLAKVS